METIEPKCYFGTKDGTVQIPVYNDIDDVKFPGDSKNYRATPIQKARYVGEGCSCEGPCEKETCFCVIQNPVPFHSDGRIKHIGKIHNHTLDSDKSICECHEGCSCKGVCEWSPSTRHLLEEDDGGVKRPQMEIVRTPNLGWSLRAAQFIPRGTYVATMVGEMRSYRQYKDEKKKKNAGLKCTFRDSVFVNYQLDMSRFFNESRFVNHSCLPNLTQVAIRRWSEETKYPTIGLVTLRDVAYGEPLTMDYGNLWLAESVRLNRKFACYCGERCCVLPPGRQPTDVVVPLEDLKAEYQAKLDQLREKRLDIYGDTLSTSSGEDEASDSDDEDEDVLELASDDDDDEGVFGAPTAAPGFANARFAGTVVDRDVEIPIVPPAGAMERDAFMWHEDTTTVETASSMDSDMENCPPQLH
ncbi:histone-lysine N-methyltransferaseH3 lysine-9 specific 3-like [Aphelenchoides avenae]|nr:histone-lysine N-methyltransferaseH3 lysine-9 specific 3-like [Aphelenchus avenae]